MFYHRHCKEVIRAFKEGRITKENALERLRYIEEDAYRRLPEAELDGDITYQVASALSEIEEIGGGSK